jgi:glycosyltransferase involved in cell wall biosynthesis
MITATIVIPIHNGSTTLSEVFSSLESQKHKELIEEIILINDNSTDDSLEIILKYSQTSSYKTKVVDHDTSHGLADNYNKGMKLSSTDFVILMHQDIVLLDLDSFIKILKPFQNDGNAIVSFPTLLHPFEVWQTYNFWQKCLFSRLIDKEIPKFSGKFDCIKKNKELEFDATRYRTAGEDYDFEIRAKKYGKILPSNLKIVHIHNKDKNFSLKKLLHKESQLAECYGVNLRRYLLYTNIKDVVIILIRPFSLALLLINFYKISFFLFIPIVLLMFILTKNVYTKSYKDLKILLLPFVNFLTISLYSYYLIKGFILKKQDL